MEKLVKNGKERYYDFYAKNLDEAYSKGYFYGNMLPSEFSRRCGDSVGFRVRSHYVAMHHKNGPLRPFIAGLETGPVPKYNIYNETGDKLLARGWYHLFNLLERRKIKVDRRGL